MSDSSDNETGGQSTIKVDNKTADEISNNATEQALKDLKKQLGEDINNNISSGNESDSDSQSDDDTRLAIHIPVKQKGKNGKHKRHRFDVEEEMWNTAQELQSEIRDLNKRLSRSKATIATLEERSRYKNLELSNLTVDNSTLKDKVNLLNKQIKNSTDQTNALRKYNKYVSFGYSFALTFTYGFATIMWMRGMMTFEF